MYYEKQINANGKPSFLFTKRINKRKGNFPLFKDKVKRKMRASTDAEAAREALEYSEDLEHLQSVASKDGKHVLTIKDKNRAARTWLELVAGVDLESLNARKEHATENGLEAKDKLEQLFEEVYDFYVIKKYGRFGEELSYFTDFGEHLLSVINDGKGVCSLSEAKDIYLQQRNIDHLSEKHSARLAVTRVTAYFIELIGDKQIDQITRKDAAGYITKRLESVKTTTVEREVTTLRAIWNRCSDHLNINGRNPFEKQPIKGLGIDSTPRKTPSLQETRSLLQILEEHKSKVDSYVQPNIAIAALTGFRLSEVWMLLEEDYDRAQKVLTLKPNRRKQELKTKNSSRPIPVLPELAAWLELYFSNRPASSPNSASSATLKWLKRNGIDFGNHSLRHGMKQRLEECNTPLHVIEELQGWSRQTMADNYGFRTANDAKRNALTAVYEKLFPKSAKIMNLLTKHQ